MSASTRVDRAKNGAPSEAPNQSESRRTWVGIDFSGRNDPRRARALVPLLVLTLIAALGVTALRIDLIRIRYAMATAAEAENALIEEQRNLIVRKRKLRDPVELAVEARDRGFRPPVRTFVLPDPGAARVPSLPAVAAGPRSADFR
jgi:hypothetical protein